MHIPESARPEATMSAGLIARNGVSEATAIRGLFSARCFGADGRLKWEAEFSNVVTDVGVRLILDQALAGSSYTAVEYLGLISSVSWSAVAAADTMSSHGGWLEASNSNAPSYGTTRPTASWSSASSRSKALASAASFTFTGSGTVQGGFLVGGSGASATVANTSGTLISAGALSPTRAVISGDTLQLSYSLGLT